MIYANLPPVWRFTDAAGSEEQIRVEGPLIANNADAFDAALEAGLGLSLHPDFMIRDRIATGVLQTAMPGWQAPRSGLYLLLPPGGPRAARVQAVVDISSRCSVAPGRPGQRRTVRHDQTPSSESPLLRLADFTPYQLSVASNAVSQLIADSYESLFGLKIPNGA